MRVMDVAEDYADQSGRLRSPTSRRSFLSGCRQLDMFLGGDAVLAAVTAEQLADFCASSTRYGKPPAPQTVRGRKSVCTTLFKWAVWRQHCRVDVSAGLSYMVRPGHATSDRKFTWLSKSESRGLVDSLDASTLKGQRDRLILLLGLQCGLRCAEIAGIRWNWFEPGFRSLRLGVAKNSKLLEIGVPSQLASEVAVWRSKTPHSSVVLPSFTNLFVALDGKRGESVFWDKPLMEGGVRDAVAEAGRNHGVHLRPHDLRRSFANMLEEDGVPLTDISRALRHENVGVTAKYLDSNPNRRIAVTQDFTF